MIYDVGKPSSRSGHAQKCIGVKPVNVIPTLLIIGSLTQGWFFQLFNWFQLFSSENCIPKVVEHSQNMSKMTILKVCVDGFSCFSLISVILFSYHNHPCNKEYIRNFLYHFIMLPILILFFYVKHFMIHWFLNIKEIVDSCIICDFNITGFFCNDTRWKFDMLDKYSIFYFFKAIHNLF